MIWRHVLKSIEKLMSPENSFHKENWSMLVRADVLKRVLMIEKVQTGAPGGEGGVTWLLLPY